MSEEQTKAIVPMPVSPLVSAAEAAKQWALFEALKAKLLNEEDYQAIAGKRYIKRSGFRKIAVYFGISDRIIKEERTDRDDGSFCWHVEVEAIAPNGRCCVGVGACDSRERKFAHLEHDVYATAQTRAKSRAISDLVAGGAVSAEELTSDGGAPPETAEPSQPWAMKVPVTKEPLKDSAIRQFPLIQGTVAIGMINLLEDGSEASMVPEKPIPADDPAITGFLLARVLDSMVAKHPGLEYRVVKSNDGTLEAILFRGRLEESQVKDLSNAARWAFRKAMEKTQKA